MSIMKKKLAATLLSGLAIASILAATALAFPQASSAASKQATKTPAAAPERPAPPAGRSGANIQGKNQDEYLADALGITVDELQTAQTKAYETAVQAALDAGDITQAQADALLSNEPGQREDLGKVRINSQKYLAGALGITDDELSAAQEKASEAQIAQAVTDGRMTQEQADAMLGQQALQKYVADNDLYTSIVKSALEDGALTQDQADALLNDAKAGAGNGLGFFGGHMGGLQGGPAGVPQGAPNGGPNGERSPRPAE